ncbi:hypothetical protein OIU84_027516 [Salix udensis]|uniref:Uncharacterized protein n=1 Tax=Salix udensis TaxID=889485 RepID=A0AAD6PAH2_9ROSI|nr:hypothetical protein OIU84_027516 [Salix udensis]
MGIEVEINCNRTSKNDDVDIHVRNFEEGLFQSCLDAGSDQIRRCSLVRSLQNRRALPACLRAVPGPIPPQPPRRRRVSPGHGRVIRRVGSGGCPGSTNWRERAGGHYERLPIKVEPINGGDAAFGGGGVLRAQELCDGDVEEEWEERVRSVWRERGERVCEEER